MEFPRHDPEAGAPTDALQRHAAEQAVEELADWQQRRTGADGAWDDLAGAGSSLLYLSPAELAQVRRQGWALDAEQVEMGTAGLAAPVRDRGGLTVAAVGISGPVERLCDGSRAPRHALLGLVQDAARAISRELAPSS